MITEKDIPNSNIILKDVFPYTIVYRYKPAFCKDVAKGDFVSKDIKSLLADWKFLLSVSNVIEEFAAFHIMPDGEIRKVICEVMNG